VTSHMSADIIIGCTIRTGGPSTSPLRLSGGKYRRSRYIGTLSTIWNGDGTLPVSNPPYRITSSPFCAVAISRSIGRVSDEKSTISPSSPSPPTRLVVPRLPPAILARRYISSTADAQPDQRRAGHRLLRDPHAAGRDKPRRGRR